MHKLASLSANVGHFLIGRYKKFDKLMRKNRFHKVCNKFLK